ncbi:MAG: UvrD-helicase domain-containing protein, partial [Fervidobacterium pennivorans]
RPYQAAIYDIKRIENIAFVEGKSAQFVSKKDVGKYFFLEGNKIYTDKISEFACICDAKTQGAMIRRIENIYDCIFIDEVQDLAGYDLEVLELLIHSKVQIMAVGDNRQATYATNYSPKNSRFKGKNIIDLFKMWESKVWCSIEERNECYRANQVICDFADALYPSMPKTISQNNSITGHDGIFTIPSTEITSYIEKYKPQVLRYRRSVDTENLQALNFGLSKGQTFPRVLIFPTGGIKHYLKNNTLDDKVGDIPKFYVAVTRAKYSVAFVFDDKPANNQITQIL